MKWLAANMKLSNVNMARSNILECYSRQLPAQSPYQPTRFHCDPRKAAVLDSAPCLTGCSGQGCAVIGWEMQDNEHVDCC